MMGVLADELLLAVFPFIADDLAGINRRVVDDALDRTVGERDAGSVTPAHAPEAARNVLGRPEVRLTRQLAHGDAAGRIRLEQARHERRVPVGLA